MPKQLFTAADIRRVSREQKSSLLILSPEDIVTPEAVDVARELGVRLLRENPDVVHGIARSLTPDSNAPLAPGFPTIPASIPPLKMVFGSGVILDPFGDGLGTPGTNVRLKDVVTSADGSSMAAGFMSLDKGEFPWSLTYDEVDVVLEGELVITRDNVAVHGRPGDVIFIPKGSNITFGTPNHVRFIYVAFPANWNDQG
jgi:ethanolamine utilization protein EutQ